MQFSRSSFILPKTGERSTRKFTLREASSRSRAHRDPVALFSDEGPFGLDNSDNGRPLTRTERLKKIAHRQGLRALHFLTSRTGKAILKCSIAYAIGSMATFVPAVSNLFGHRQDSKHLVATVVVYFHPARTIGSMHEATILAAIAVAYAAFISFTSMALSMFFATNDLLVVGHMVVLIVFVGGGLGTIALVKQRLGNPLVNVAASLASLGCITILLKEGSVQAGRFSHQKVVQILCMVIMGIIITTVVNFLIFPILARRRLSSDMEQNTDLLGEMLVSITRAFLRGEQEELSGDYYKQMSAEHQTSLNTMKQNLGEAKMEFLAIGKERLYAVQARIVACLSELSQDLGGLHSAANAQFSFISQTSMDGSPDRAGNINFGTLVASPTQELTQYPGLGIISEEGESAPQLSSSVSTIRNFDMRSSLPPTLNVPGSDTPPRFSADSPTPESTDVYNSVNLMQSPGEMFIAFISRLGPPTKSLVFTMKQILDELPFRSKPNSAEKWNPWIHRSLEVAVDEQLHSSLRLAVEMYRQSRVEALAELHQSRAMNAAINAQQGLKSKFGQRSATSASGNDLKPSKTPPPSQFYQKYDEILADIEEVSACCGHFSFSLLDFAEDVLTYLEILQELKAEMEAGTHSWKWLQFWNWRRRSADPHPSVVPPAMRTHGIDSEVGVEVAAHIRKIDLSMNPSNLPKPWYTKIHRALRVLRRDDVVFAIKVGIGAIIYAFPAFLNSTRPFFSQWRGEWGLVTYMLVCCMTVGASNTTGLNRFVGTVIGSLLAVAAWVLSSHHGVADPVLLAFLGFLVSLPCFYINIAKKDGPFCRFILLTYNLGALYSYSLSIHDDDNDDDEGGIDPAIWDIVVHRFVSVIVGVIWGLIVSRLIWPVKARRKLTDGLSVLWLRMGLIFRRDPLMTIILGDPNSHYMDIREESDLHTFLGTLKTTCKAAASEFELEGPFPNDIFNRTLSRTERMLDAFHALNVVIRKNLQFTPGEAAVLRFTRAERMKLSARISHLFTVLASSIKLEYPISDALPDIENSRDQLLSRISEYRRNGPGREVTTEQDYELLYAYVLVTGQLARDIHAIVPDMETLYGTLNEENLKLE
jgi:hypothetical protein